MPKILRAVGQQKKGGLIVFEGIDGSGKSTQVNILKKNLVQKGKKVVVSNWYTSNYVYNLMMSLNFRDFLSKEAAVILGASELMARLEYVLVPALEDPDTIVIADKYIFAGIAHDIARNGEGYKELSEEAYSSAPIPDVTVYIDLDPRNALQRKRKGKPLGYWESGLDLHLDVPISRGLRLYEEGRISDKEIGASFLHFQGNIQKEYEKLFVRYKYQNQHIQSFDGSKPEEDLGIEIFQYICEMLQLK